MLNINRSIKTIGVPVLSLMLMSFSGSGTATLFANTINTISENDGLQLQSKSRHLTTYLKPGVNLESYKLLNIEAVTVTFKAKWLKNYNRDQKTAYYRLKDKDVKAIKDRVAKQFHRSFTKELENKGGYTIVDTSAKNTLLIKPSIIDLVINGPEKANPDNKVTMVRTAGRATLALEIYDANTGQLLGKTVDKERTQEHYELIRTNRIRNSYEFIPVYKSWARNLQEVLR